jgi:hypothetical protein
MLLFNRVGLNGTTVVLLEELGVLYGTSLDLARAAVRFVQAGNRKRSNTAGSHLVSAAQLTLNASFSAFNKIFHCLSASYLNTPWCNRGSSSSSRSSSSSSLLAAVCDGKAQKSETPGICSQHTRVSPLAAGPAR